tara:strand:- start:1066 stop:1371 length:306 start_codon:yes stop_codon:yes gene_type:complete
MKEYLNLIALTKNLDNLNDKDLKSYLSIGLAGEVGEVLNLIKKDLFYTNHSVERERICDELGDCLYYLCNLVNELGFTIDDVIDKNSKKVKKIIDKHSAYR